MPTNLNPISETSAIVLTSTGSAANVAAALPFGVYSGNDDFLSGAAVQVAYTYKKLGGDVVDIELTPANVYAAYEEAVLEYSYILNIHQTKNSLSTYLGEATGTFDHNGDRKSGPENVNLKFPRFTIGYSRRVGDGAAAAGGMGGTVRQYSASFQPANSVQDYDLQAIVQSASVSGVDDEGTSVPFSGAIDNKRIVITKVYYKSPRAMWRFYGYYGGFGVVGNYSTYGQFADDSTFEVIPTWQNKMQAMMYEDSIVTRTSNYAYEIINNRLRMYPAPDAWSDGYNDRVWFRFYVDITPWEEDGTTNIGVGGINNMNTAPFDNLPYNNINAIGKQWIRKYALAVCKEMLGQIRGKFTTMPIPGDSVTLNHSELLSQAKDEQQQLKEKLMEILDTMTYDELAKSDQEVTDAATNILKVTPLPIFIG
jgi:hypothetical protein